MSTLFGCARTIIGILCVLAVGFGLLIRSSGNSHDQGLGATLIAVGFVGSIIVFISRIASRANKAEKTAEEMRDLLKQMNDKL